MYVFSWHLSTLAAACLLACTVTNLSLGFGSVLVSDVMMCLCVYVCVCVYVRVCVGEVVERSGHYHHCSQQLCGQSKKRKKGEGGWTGNHIQRQEMKMMTKCLKKEKHKQMDDSYDADV